MKRIFTILLVLSISISAFAADRYWVGGASGAWTTAASWNTMSDGSGTSGAPGTSDYVYIDADCTVTFSSSVTTSINKLTIKSGRTVTFSGSAAVTLGNSTSVGWAILVESGATLNLTKSTTTSSHGIRLKLQTNTFVSPAIAPIVEGTIKCVEGSGSLLDVLSSTTLTVNGTVELGTNASGHDCGNISNAGTITFGANSFFKVKRTSGATIPAATWNATSTIDIDISGTTPFVSFSGSSPYTFGNFKWRAINQSGTTTIFGTNTVTFAGNVNVINTGTSGIRFSSSTGSGTTPITINGDLIIDNGATLSLFNSSSGSAIFLVKGNVTNNGNMRINENGTGIGVSLNIEKDISCGSNSQTFANAAGISAATTPTIRTVGTGTQTLNLQNLHGANINMVFGNANNIVLSSDIDTLRYCSSITGKLLLGTYNVKLNGATASMPGGTSNYMVTNSTGAVTIVNLPATGLEFKIGASTSTFDPVYITPTNATTFTVKVKNTFTNAVIDPAKCQTKEWEITTAGGQGNTNLEFTSDATTANSAPTEPVIGHYTLGAWEEKTATVGVGVYTANTWSITAYTGSFSPFGIGEKGGFATVLPLELITLDAQPKGNLNIINWTTANEVNIKEFAIESSSDNRIWRTIGNKAATGGSKTTTYTYNDETPSVLNYYRIKSIEFSGKEQTSKVVAVKRNGSKFALVSVSPIPTTEGVTIDFTIAKNSRLTATITDIVGKVVKTQSIEAIEGNNSMRLDLSNMTKGIYILSLNDGETTATQRIIKQ